METLGILWLVAAIVGPCIAIAPLIIWRNTNRANQLLALIAVQLGAAPRDVQAVLSGGSARIAAGKEHKLCPDCGARVVARAESCPGCGHQFKLAPRPLACPECGQDITHMPESCPKCGREFKYSTKAERDARRV